MSKESRIQTRIFASTGLIHKIRFLKKVFYFKFSFSVLKGRNHFSFGGCQLFLNSVICDHF